MVKGVNRTVIEVNDTGSKMFEKIVFYVSAEYGNLSAKSLQKAADELSLGLESYPRKSSLRRRMIIKRRIALFASISILCLVGIGVSLLILL